MVMVSKAFANTLAERLEAKGWDIAELARQIDSSYEYVRQLVRGYTLPGKHLLKNICKVLDLDQEATSGLVARDKLMKKFGGALAALNKKEPRFSEMERLLPQLTEEQFDFILGAVEGIARRNRRSEAAVASSQSKPRVFKDFSPLKAKLEKVKVTK